jgi:hypothetical protein
MDWDLFLWLQPMGPLSIPQNIDEPISNTGSVILTGKIEVLGEENNVPGHLFHNGKCHGMKTLIPQ